MMTYFNQNQRKYKCGLIVMDLPKWKKYEKWKVVSLLWVTYPGGKKNMKNGLNIMGDLPRWKMWRVVPL